MNDAGSCSPTTKQEQHSLPPHASDAHASLSPCFLGDVAGVDVQTQRVSDLNLKRDIAISRVLVEQPNQRSGYRAAWKSSEWVVRCQDIWEGLLLFSTRKRKRRAIPNRLKLRKNGKLANHTTSTSATIISFTYTNSHVLGTKHFARSECALALALCLFPSFVSATTT